MDDIVKTKPWPADYARRHQAALEAVLLLITGRPRDPSGRDVGEIFGGMTETQLEIFHVISAAISLTDPNDAENPPNLAALRRMAAALHPPRRKKKGESGDEFKARALDRICEYGRHADDADDARARELLGQLAFDLTDERFLVAEGSPALARVAGLLRAYHPSPQGKPGRVSAARILASIGQLTGALDLGADVEATTKLIGVAVRRYTAKTSGKPIQR